MRWTSPLCVLTFSLILSSVALGADGNRLTYLDDFSNPYWVGLDAPKLVTPQWVGQEGVEAVILLAIDDMREPGPYENYLRPILDRLKKLDGRAPVSIMTNRIDPADPHLQKWITEGVSIEPHTYDHPCPCLNGSDFDRAKNTYDQCVDLISQIPNMTPIGFRMPCCDSMNSMSPRFYAEIFNSVTPKGNFLRMNSSVFMLFTPADPALPRELVLDKDGGQRFAKYVPTDRGFVNYVENYPYPYVVSRLCWEMPSAVPDDWQGFNLQQSYNPITVRDMKAAIDATFLKQGVYTLTFHPGGWIRNDQVIDMLDHAVRGREKKVLVLNFPEVHERLTKNLLGGHPLRAANGQDNGVRLLDINADGYLDVVVGNADASITRIWDPESGQWAVSHFPVGIVDADGRDAGVRFGVLQASGCASMLVRNERMAGLWHWRDGAWVKAPDGLVGLAVDGRSVRTRSYDRDTGVRLRDLDADGVCEIIVGSDKRQGVFRRSADGGHWDLLPYSLPEGTAIVDSSGRDAGLRFVDPDGDGHDDVVFSNAYRYSVHRFTSAAEGWSQTMVNGRRGEQEAADEIPMIVRADGSNNGAWFAHNRMWVQNEDTAGMDHHVDSRHMTALLGTDREPSARSPEDSARSIRVADGFVVEQMAAEPLVRDPVDVAWGPDGKMWIVEYADYPLGLENRGIACGRIRYLEDTTGDGRYDKSTLFIDPISCPMGILPWRDGVIVTAAPEIFYAEDTDGDGRADVHKTLFKGFVEGNHQHRVNTPRWGLDNWVHAANGDSGGVIRSLATGDEVNISGRDLRFKPDTGAIDGQSGQSQFGASRDDWGNWFGCNNSVPGWHYALADHYIRRNPHVAPPSGRVDMAPDKSVYPIGRVISHCDLIHRPHAAWGQPGIWTSLGGVCIYRDDLFGSQYTGNLFVGDSVYNVVHRRILEPDGVTFRGQRGPDETQSEFLASHDIWFRTAAVQTGPDGALWVLDMCRFVIEHPEWIDDELEKTLDLRAGQDLGRVYRIYPVDKKPRAIPRLDHLDTPGLVAALDSPSGWQRDMAHQMLLWRADMAAVSPLEQTVLHSARATARLHALCALDGLKSLHPRIATVALADEHPGVRRHAIRVSEPLLGSDSQLDAAILKLENDPEPQVLMQLGYSLGQWTNPQAGRVLGRMAVRHADDRYIRAAVMSSAVGHLAAMVDETLSDSERSVAQTPLFGTLLDVAIGVGDTQAVTRALHVITAQPASGYARWQFEAMGRLLDELDRRGTTIAAFAAPTALEGVRALFDAAHELASDERADTAERISVLPVLGRGLDSQAEDLDLLVTLLAPQESIDLQLAAVQAMGRLQLEDVPRLLLDGWGQQSPKLNAAIVDTLLSRAEWSATLLDHIEQEPTLSTILGTTRREQLLRFPDEAVRRRAAELLGESTTAEDILEKLREYEPVTKTSGDAARGKDVFTEATCGDCHKLGEVGKEVATDLRTLIDKSPAALLVALVDPNRAVEDKYIEYTALTSDGLMLTGMLAEETGNSVRLVDVNGESHTIRRRDIDELVSTGRSHMPEKLDEKVDLKQMADLFAFIAAAHAPRRETPGNAPRLVEAAADGALKLAAADCEIYAPGVTMGNGYLLWMYDGPNDHVTWSLDVPRSGKYDVWIVWAQVDEYADNPIAIEVEGGSSRLTAELPSTGGWGNVRREKFGELTLDSGRSRIILRPNGPIAKELSDLRGLELIPAG